MASATVFESNQQNVAAVIFRQQYVKQVQVFQTRDFIIYQHVR